MRPALRWHHSAFSVGLLSNRWALAGAAAVVAAQLGFTYAPVMNAPFHSAPMTSATWLLIAGVALIVFAVVELEKWLRFRRREAGALPE
jgi:cation-transporting ATPase F